MNKSIRLHKEHGLNPTISQCMYCGKDKNEIALLGAGYKDQAPMHMILDLEPCEDCKENVLTVGTAIVEAEGDQRNPIPTGRCFVMKDEAFERMFNMKPPEHKIILLEKGGFEQIVRANNITFNRR